MKTGIIISSNDAETCWNALRFANFRLEPELRWNASAKVIW